jgi:hypothetical protein
MPLAGRKWRDTVDAMLFDFDLRPLADIEPWGRPGKATLHWFGLTDGYYWMNVGSSRLFEYSEAARQLGTPQFCDYQVARLYEDVVDALANILEPVPSDLRAYLSGTGRGRTVACMTAWSEVQAKFDDAYWTTAEHAVTWIAQRNMSTAYLSPSVNLTMWSDDAAVHVEWDNRAKTYRGVPAWSATHGSFSVPRQQFAQGVRSFHERLMRAMAERVDRIVAGGLSPDIHVDVPALVREQQIRASVPLLNFGPPMEPTDWDAVRQALRTIHA